MSKKVVLTLNIHDGKDKQKAMKAVSKLAGIDSLAMELKDRKLTVIGEVDPCQLVAKLRKYWHTEIVTVGPAKEENKKENKEEKDKPVVEPLDCYNYPCNIITRPPYVYYCTEENPNSCVIC